MEFTQEQAQAMYAALKRLVDKDLTYFDGFVERGMIRAQDIQRARAALAKVQVPA